MIPNFITKFFNLFKKKESTLQRMERWEAENKETERLKELHKSARSQEVLIKKKKSKPVTYNF